MSFFICGNSLNSISAAHVNLDMSLSTRTQKSCWLVRTALQKHSNCHCIILRGVALRTHPLNYLYIPAPLSYMDIYIITVAVSSWTKCQYSCPEVRISQQYSFCFPYIALSLASLVSISEICMVCKVALWFPLEFHFHCHISSKH